jgi:hypothetical protein
MSAMEKFIMCPLLADFVEKLIFMGGKSLHQKTDLIGSSTTDEHNSFDGLKTPEIGFRKIPKEFFNRIGR